MKTIATFIITGTLISAQAMADGGYQWEQTQEAIGTIQHLHLHAPTAAGMDHTAVEHKRWMVDDAYNTELKSDQPIHRGHEKAKHTEHMGSDHKRYMFGPNN